MHIICNNLTNRKKKLTGNRMFSRQWICLRFVGNHLRVIRPWQGRFRVLIDNRIQNVIFIRRSCDVDHFSVPNAFQFLRWTRKQVQKPVSVYQLGSFFPLKLFNFRQNFRSTFLDFDDWLQVSNVTLKLEEFIPNVSV